MNIEEDECYCDEMDYGPFAPKCSVCLSQNDKDLNEVIEPFKATKQKPLQRANMSKYDYFRKKK